MDTTKALEIRDALITLADTLDMDIKTVAINVCLLDDEKYKILQDASVIWNKFANAEIVERGKMLGITIHTSK